MSPYKPDQHHRSSTRLRGYNYAQVGMYFVTIVTQNRACLFGHVEDGYMQLNDARRIAESCWMAIPEHFPHVMLDAYIIMPNHVHGIVVITEYVGASVGAHVGVKIFRPYNIHHPYPNPHPKPSVPSSVVSKSASPNGFGQIRMFMRCGSAITTTTSFATNHP